MYMQLLVWLNVSLENGSPKSWSGNHFLGEKSGPGRLLFPSLKFWPSNQTFILNNSQNIWLWVVCFHLGGGLFKMKVWLEDQNFREANNVSDCIWNFIWWCGYIRGQQFARWHWWNNTGTDCHRQTLLLDAEPQLCWQSANFLNSSAELGWIHQF